MPEQTVATMETLAEEARQHFERIERGERGSGDYIWTTKDDAPAWVGDMVYGAHGHMLPDDWRYTAIVHALDAIAEGSDENDGATQFADSEVDVYNGNRILWLSTNMHRESYVEEAREEGLIPADATVTQQLGCGQYIEALEIYGAVWGALSDELDARGEEDDDR